MHSYIKERIKDVDIYRISMNEFKQIFRDLLFMSGGTNIYIDEICVVRDSDHKGYFFDFESGDVDFQYEILFLKMYKLGLIELQLFSCALDLDTREGKEFYRFLDRFLKSSDIFNSSELGSTEYDVKKIVEYHYEEFINHIYENMDVQDEEYFEDFTSNRLLIRAYIKNMRGFFDKISDLIYQNADDTLQEREKIIQQLNEKNNEYYITFHDFLNSKSHYFRYLKHLESKGKLVIREIKQNHHKPGSFCFILEKKVSYFNGLFLESLPYDNSQGIAYADGEIFIKNIKVKFQDGSKIHILFRLIFDYYKQNKVNFVTHYELSEFYKQNKKKYFFPREPDFKYDSYRRDIEIKNESLPFKDFLGIDFKGIQCKYLKPETL